MSEVITVGISPVEGFSITNFSLVMCLNFPLPEKLLAFPVKCLIIDLLTK